MSHVAPRVGCRTATVVCRVISALGVLALVTTGALRAQNDTADPLQQAHTLADGNHLPQAEVATRSYLQTHETSADARYLLAYILFREDKPLPSLAEYTRAAQLQKPTPQQLQNVALDYVLAGDYVDADKWMTTVAAWAPGDGEAWYSLGRIKYTENRFGEAVACFQKALALIPQSVKAENNLGLAYEGLDRNTDALAAYRQSIAWQAQSSQPSAQPYINLGTLLLAMNQVDAAQPALLQAQALAPNDPRLRMTTGKLYQRKGDLPQAQVEFEHAVALSPNTAAYHFLLGQVYRKTGQSAKATAEFARAAQLDGAHSSR